MDCWKREPRKIADGGHQGLEGAEIEGDDDGVFLVEVFRG